MVLHALRPVVIIAKVLKPEVRLDAGDRPLRIITLEREDMLFRESADADPVAKLLLHAEKLLHLIVDVKQLLLEVDGRRRQPMPAAGRGEHLAGDVDDA